MPYRNRLQHMNTVSSRDSVQLVTELDALRAELDDIRAKYTALRALLAAGTAPGTAYNTGTGLNNPTFTPN